MSYPGEDLNVCTECQTLIAMALVLSGEVLGNQHRFVRSLSNQ